MHTSLLTLALAVSAGAFIAPRRSIIQTRRRAATNVADELLRQRADPTLAKDERRTIDALLVDHAWDRAVNSSSPSTAATLFDRRDALDAAKPPRRLAAAAAVAPRHPATDGRAQRAAGALRAVGRRTRLGRRRRPREG